MASKARPKGDAGGPEQQNTGDPEREEREDDGQNQSDRGHFRSGVNRWLGGHAALTAPLFDADRSGTESGDL
jgi:hypothetical protein